MIEFGCATGAWCGCWHGEVSLVPGAGRRGRDHDGGGGGMHAGC